MNDLANDYESTYHWAKSKYDSYSELAKKAESDGRQSDYCYYLRSMCDYWRVMNDMADRYDKITGDNLETDKH